MSNLATWFTPSLQTISRSSGRSAVAASAYRACAKLYDERTGITHDFRPKAKKDLVCNLFVGVPNNDISKLFNDAERAESRSNSTVARELMLPLPHSWNDSQRRDCVYEIANMLNNKYNVAVQASIHRKSKHNKNEHTHILFTTREVDANGKFGKKTRILDDKKTNEVSKLRETICEIVNAHAVTNKSDWYVYAGKFSDIIEDHIPTHHISINHGRKQKEFIELNRIEVADARQELESIKNKIAEIDRNLRELSQGITNEQEVAENAINEINNEIEQRRLDAIAKYEKRLKVEKWISYYRKLTIKLFDVDGNIQDMENDRICGYEIIEETLQEYKNDKAKLDNAISVYWNKFEEPDVKAILKEYDLKIEEEEQPQLKVASVFTIGGGQGGDGPPI
jgi:hypothetical protein